MSDEIMSIAPPEPGTVWMVGQPSFEFRLADTTYAGQRAYRAFRWETEGRHRWAGRNWRRLKREWRKFVYATD